MTASLLGLRLPLLCLQLFGPLTTWPRLFLLVFNVPDAKNDQVLFVGVVAKHDTHRMQYSIHSPRKFRDHSMWRKWQTRRSGQLPRRCQQSEDVLSRERQKCRS
jgi:hypothetical protein